MPRPKRSRKICEEPYFNCFSPDMAHRSETVTMTVDEYETIRLVDFEKKTHDECAGQMEISRTTVTEIYEAARYKIADAIVNGKTLLIKGGNYRLCEGNISGCHRCGYQSAAEKNGNIIKKEKGRNTMRIAVTYENEQIFQHFGHTEAFKLYDAENGVVTAKTIVGTDGQGHGALSAFLKDQKVDVLICGGIGGGAKMALQEYGIQLYGGASGNCDEAVEAFLKGKLSYQPDATCSHHEHEHNGASHTCGEHGCGKHNCGHNH